MPVSHAFTSAITNETSAGRVRPTDWNAGHVVNVNLATEVTGVLDPSNIPDVYIKKDGTSTTTAVIPFTLGALAPTDNYFEVGNTALNPEFVFGYTAGAGNLGGVRKNGSNLNIFAQDGNGSNNGGSIFISGGGQNGGDVNFGAVWIGSSTFTLPTLITAQNDLYVGGNFVCQSGGFFKNNVTFGGFSTAAPQYIITIDGQSNRTIGMQAQATAATQGNTLTISSSAAYQTGTNLNGGDLILSSGIAQGNGRSKIIMNTSGGGGSGNSAAPQIQAALWDYNQVTIADAYDIVLNTSTGTKIGTGSTQKLALWGATPTTQSAAATNLGTVLSNLGARVAGTAYTLGSSGAFTWTGTFGSSGVSSFTNATDSSSISTGGVIISGGVGISKKLYANTINITGGGTTLAPLNITASAAPTSPVVGDIWNDSTQNMMTFYNGNKLYQAGNLYTATADKVINTTTPTTSFSGTAIGTTTIKANSLKVGQKFAIWGAGYYSTPIGNTATVTITVKIGSVTVSTVTTGIFPASASNLPFDFLLQFTIRSTGGSATLVCDGAFNYSTALSAVAKTSNSLSSIGTITFDSTVDEALDVLASWSTTTTQTATVQQSKIDFL